MKILGVLASAVSAAFLLGVGLVVYAHSNFPTKEMLTRIQLSVEKAIQEEKEKRDREIDLIIASMNRRFDVIEKHIKD